MRGAPLGGPVRRSQRTLAELVAEQLHEEIISGAIPAGSHLRLNELASRLQISPMPVREAVRRLEALGLVDQHPHRGAFVRPLSLADLQDTMRVRVMLERAAVERAAADFAPADAKEAGELLVRYRELLVAERRVEAREAHTAFHFALYRAAGSRWLLHAIEPVWRNGERYRFAPADAAPSADALVAEHQAILDACREGRSERAGDALARHLERAAARMAANIPDGAAP
jgi:DNA-binding GntR family transcriptional regulator